MKKLDTSELELLIRLNTNEDFTAFIQILRDSAYELTVRSSLLRDEVDVRWNQGRVQEILDILKKVGDSRQDLDYLHSKRLKD